MADAQASVRLDMSGFQRGVDRACARLRRAFEKPALTKALRDLGEHAKVLRSFATGDALDRLALDRGLEREWYPASARARSFIGEDDASLRSRVLKQMRIPGCMGSTAWL
jgi:hypothetical protein